MGKFQLPHDTRPERIGAIRLLSAILSLAVSFYLLTGLFGSRLGELESFLPPMTENAFAAARNGKPSGEIEWIKNDYPKALRLAKESNRKVFINFTGYTCTNCRWMEANMFTRADVRAELDKMICVELFTDGEGEIYQKQQQFQETTFQTVALPFYVVADPQGKPLTTFPGLTRSPSEFLSFLQKGD